MAITVDWFLKHFDDVEIPPETLAACHALESEGLRFCIDFGYQNAESIWSYRVDAEYESTFEGRNA